MAPIQKKVHINVDLGEGYGNFKCGPDEGRYPRSRATFGISLFENLLTRQLGDLIPLIDHANIVRAPKVHPSDLFSKPFLRQTYPSQAMSLTTFPSRPAASMPATPS